MCDEDCDWSACFSLCEQICRVVGYLCVCCIEHYEKNNSSKCTDTQETNFANPVNSNETLTQQPLSQGDSCLPQQSPPQEFAVQQCQPSNFAPQKYPTAPTFGLNPSAPMPDENNCSSNQSTGGITSSIYPALPPSYAEAVGLDTCQVPACNSPNTYIAKA